MDTPRFAERFRHLGKPSSGGLGKPNFTKMNHGGTAAAAPKRRYGAPRRWEPRRQVIKSMSMSMSKRSTLPFDSLKPDTWHVTLPRLVRLCPNQSAGLMHQGRSLMPSNRIKPNQGKSRCGNFLPKGSLGGSVSGSDVIRMWF